jgi:multicomponent K+:H+ antiporter subunit E
MGTEKPGMLPHSFLSSILAAAWLLAHNSVSPLHLAGAAVLGVGLPWLTRKFGHPTPMPRRPFAALWLLLIFAVDILWANLQVAGLVLGPNKRLQPAFVRIPIDLKNDYTVMALASMTTLTPGTLAADFDKDERVLLVHALHCTSEDALIRRIKHRYERRLAEIFEC